MVGAGGHGAASPTIGVVTVSYHSENEVRGLLEALDVGPVPVSHICVVSNSGDCGVFDGRPRTTVLSLDHNIGFARACNLGASRLDTEYIAFCNPDLRITATQLANLVNALRQHPTYALVSAHYGHQLNDEPTGSISEATTLVAGACMVMSRAYFEALGRWEESYFLWGEDRDLCSRIWARGDKIGWVDGIVAVHSSGHSVQDLTPATRQFLNRAWVCSQVNFRLRNHGWATALSYLVGMCGANAARALLGRSAPHRGYSLPGEAATFGLLLLANVWRLPRYIAFDGRQYPWGAPVSHRESPTGQRSVESSL